MPTNKRTALSHAQDRESDEIQYYFLVLTFDIYQDHYT